jgi:HK97 family phage prohead protease
MNSLDFQLDLKAIDESGNIEGLAVGYGNVDFGGDQVMPGAVDYTRLKSLPMLLFHDMKRPIGVWTEFKETTDGLFAKGRISLAARDGKEAHGLAKDGALAGLSMGYRAIKHRFEGKTRQLLQVALHEVSLVAIPMNDRTVVTGVKDILEGGALPTLPEFEEFLRESGFSKTQATAIAGKGLASLLRGEPGNEPTADFWSALGAQLRA